MIRKKLFFLALFFLLYNCVIETPMEPEDEVIYENDTTRYIMTFENRVQMAGARMLLDSLGYNIFYTAKNIPTVIADIPEIRKLQKTYASTFNAMYIEKDTLAYELHPVTAGLYNVVDTTAWLWNMTMIKADSVWAMGVKGQGVRIIIIDTGLCPDYRSMPVFVAFDSSLSFNPYTDSTDIEGASGHGSHVFVTIAGQPYEVDNGILQGVAPDANVGMVKMFESMSATTAMAVKSVDIAISLDPDIISMSWGGGAFSPSLSLLFTKGAEKGIAFVASAGNNSRSPISYPARYPKVISVGSINRDGGISYFSSYGAELDLMAPGEAVLSFDGCSPGTKSGTSMSAPHVTGAIALYIQYYREEVLGGGPYFQHKPPISLIYLDLRVSAADMHYPGWDIRSGFGVLQIMDFLREATAF